MKRLIEYFGFAVIMLTVTALSFKLYLVMLGWQGREYISTGTTDLFMGFVYMLVGTVGYLGFVPLLVRRKERRKRIYSISVIVPLLSAGTLLFSTLYLKESKSFPGQFHTSEIMNVSAIFPYLIFAMFLLVLNAQPVAGGDATR